MVSKLFVQEKGFYQTILKISLPIIAQNMITMFINIIGTIMLGSFGEEQLSASSLANEFINVFFIFCMGIGGGAGVITAQCWGNRDIPSLRHTVTLMLWLILAFATLFTVVTFAMPGVIMGMYTKNEAIIAYGVEYFRIAALCYVMMGISLTVTIVLRTVRQVRVPLITSVVSFALNIFISWVLIFGKFGMPRMQIQGAAVAMVVARFSEMVMIGGYLLFVDQRIGYRVKDFFVTRKEQALLFWKYGAPVIVSDAMLAFGNNMVAIIMGHIGAGFVAANAIVAPIMRLATVFNQGVSQSSGVIVGNALGEGKVELAQKQSVTFLTLSIIIGLLSAAVILSLTPALMTLYKLTEETRQITFQLMASVSVTAVFFTVQGMLTKGVLRAGGDTRFLMLADVLFLWVASIPLGYLAGIVWGLSPFWIYAALKADWVIKSVWCTLRLKSRKWLHCVNEKQEV